MISSSAATARSLAGREPIEMLRASMARIGAGDFTAVPALRGEGEFQELGQALGHMAQELQHSSRHVEQAVTQVLVDLQFQDRVSQIVGHVTDDMRRLQDCLQQLEPLDRTAWLRQLESTYTTLEQQHIHGGGSASSAQQSSGVTFF